MWLQKEIRVKKVTSNQDLNRQWLPGVFCAPLSSSRELWGVSDTRKRMIRRRKTWVPNQCVNLHPAHWSSDDVLDSPCSCVGLCTSCPVPRLQQGLRAGLRRLRNKRSSLQFMSGGICLPCQEGCFCLRLPKDATG